MGESRIIVTANQKGGVGKSTLAMLLANYLSEQMGVQVGAIVDTDFQSSIIEKRKEDLKTFQGTEQTPNYQVVSYNLANHQQIPAFVRQLRQTNLTYIIDTPGMINANGVFAFVALADYIVCPFDYDSLTLSSTTQFLKFWDNFKATARKETGYEVKTTMILTPCMKPKKVGNKTETEVWELVKDQFASLYHVSPEIPDSAVIRRVDTMSITPAQLRVAGDCLYSIANIIFNPNTTEDNGKQTAETNS